MSNLCRFTGQIAYFYSVAQHSVLVSRLCLPRNAFKGLLHDAAEAYINDLNRPLKYSGLIDGYRDIEDNVSQAIAEHFGLDSLEKPVDVEAADKYIVQIEKRDLVNELSLWEFWKRRLTMRDFIAPWSPATAKHYYLKRFKELTSEKNPVRFRNGLPDGLFGSSLAGAATTGTAASR